MSKMSPTQTFVRSVLIISLECVLSMAVPLGKYVREFDLPSELGTERKNETTKRHVETTLTGGRQRQMVSLRSNVENDLKTELQIEVVAAVIIASLFAVFFVVYAVCLQCWWRCKSDSKFESTTSTSCSCLCLTDLDDRAR